MGTIPYKTVSFFASITMGYEEPMQRLWRKRCCGSCWVALAGK